MFTLDDGKFIGVVMPLRCGEDGKAKKTVVKDDPFDHSEDAPEKAKEEGDEDAEGQD